MIESQQINFDLLAFAFYKNIGILQFITFRSFLRRKKILILKETITN